MQFLLEIHIGPMQKFIAAARRTRDLWFGSWLMSELSKAAARGIVEQDEKNRLIFPAHDSNLAVGSNLGVSNKVAALVADPGAAAKAAKDALDTRYDGLINSASLDKKLNPEASTRAHQQLHSFLEFYWVSYPENGEYSQARNYADALLAARKNTRNFKAVDWVGEKLPKSSLDGRMETVTPPKSKKETEAEYAKLMYSDFRARPGEQLSGVDLLKRLGMSDDDKSRFPSTSHMAAMPLRRQLQANAGEPIVKAEWDNYIAALTKVNPEIEKQEVVYHKLQLPILDEFDGSLLFESRLLDFMDKSETAVPKQKLKEFLKAADLSEPNPYYALLVADGDSMGEALASMKTAAEHRTFSQELAKFAEEARGIVAEHDGAVVYAGGDDVLALLPLPTAVLCTEVLATTFHEMMGGLTFSAGIAIVHHLEPLEDALELARSAEKEAKRFKKVEKVNGEEKESKKNALAITLNKRSGVPRTIVGRWGEIDVRLTQFAAYYSANALPKGLAYQLRDMYLHLGGQEAMQAALQDRDNGKTNSLPDVIAIEAQRIINRKEGDPEAAAYVAQSVENLDHKQNNIESLSSELIIAAHTAAAQEHTQLSIGNRQSQMEEPHDPLDN
ncbi:MAG: type III-B CRISPR-associated protein Cas10/Cmr2 [Anaerolineales bacterium]|nr:type III-B CRISPR-associated protein Cas10/Cmr2 [Anaerolineales bacterium]